MSLAIAVRASGPIEDLCVLEELDLPKVVKAANQIAKAYKPAG
jgi:hypothetical protein